MADKAIWLKQLMIGYKDIWCLLKAMRGKRGSYKSRKIVCLERVDLSSTLSSQPTTIQVYRWKTKNLLCN